jgi:hypothetical protein
MAAVATTAPLQSWRPAAVYSFPAGSALAAMARTSRMATMTAPGWGAIEGRPESGTKANRGNRAEPYAGCHFLGVVRDGRINWQNRT